MFCECGHTIRIGHDRLCERCKRKERPGTLGIDWHNMGRLARQTGAPRMPLMDNKVLNALRHKGDEATITSMWLGGWEAE